MFCITGSKAKDLCDPHLRPTRRDVMRIGGAGMFGLSLAPMLQLQAATNAVGHQGGPGWGKAKSIILLYLQGGPSHLDLWDPKENVPDNVRSAYKTISTKIPGVQFTEILPRLSQLNDRFTMIRSMSYSPNGLFNHTAAIYQMMTGYTTDKVSPSGQLEPPSPKDFPNFGSNIVHLRPLDEPMLPFVMLPRPLQESNVVGKGGTAGFLGKAFDPYTLYPDGDDMDMEKMDRIQIDDLTMRQDMFSVRLQRRAQLRELVSKSAAELEKSLAGENLDQYYNQALQLILSGRAREAFDLSRESPATRERYGTHRWGQMGLLARRLVESGVTFVTMNTAPDSLCWDWHLNIVNDKRPADGSNGPSRGMDISGPPLDQMLSALVSDLYERGLDKRVLLLVWGEFGRTPRVNTTGGRDHWGALMSILMAGGGLQMGQVIGASTPKGEVPAQRPVHPNDVLTMVYRHLGIDPADHTVNLDGRPIPILPDGQPIRELI